MLARRHSFRATIVALLAVLAGGAATAAPGPASAGLAPTIVTSGAGVAALATDQLCTARAAAGSTLRAVTYRADDLSAMPVPKSSLGSRVSTYEVDWFRYGFMDNAELGHIELTPAGTCGLNRTNGRISGFARAFTGGSPYQDVATETDLFFTAAGAANWVSGFVAGLRKLPGSRGVTSVRVATLAGPGTGARMVTIRFSSGRLSKWLLFRRGPLVGSVIDTRPATATAAIDVSSVARTLSARMSARMSLVRGRSDSRFDAVMQLSAGLPKAMLGSRYQGLVWDWWYGGCWDVAEGASQTVTASEAKAYRANASKYGQLTFCRAMHEPPHNQQTYNRVSRVFSGGTLYRTANGADGALTQLVADWQRRAGTTSGGIAYGALTRFSPGVLGDRAVGLQQRMGSDVLIRVVARYGRYLAVSQLATPGFTGMRGDVKRWASLLDRRVRALMTTRTF
ncbi:MAG TPA: hypothetical protein VFH66_07535 [Mycobacteriales bacterium]|nr:hypothetical protein [Mycobacteriales bacterium]